MGDVIPESEQVELYDGPRGKRRIQLRKTPIGIAVLIVAVVVLSALSVSLWSLADHYHDSKYRSQHVLMSFLWSAVQLVPAGIDDMLDASTRTDHERLSSAQFAIMNLRAAYAASRSIEVMYPDNSQEAETFVAIGRAASQLDHVVSHYESNLMNALVHNVSYEANQTVNSLFHNACLQAGNLSDMLYSAFDQTRDWSADPYSHVKRLDLTAVRETADQLESLGIQLAHFLP